MKNIPVIIGGAAVIALAGAACTQKVGETDIISSSEQYTVYTDRVEQGDFTATAVSPTEIVTNYKSPESSVVSTKVKFRFSLNSRDNELPLGQSHTALIGGEEILYSFGEVQEAETQLDKTAKGDTLANDTQWTIRVDMRPMLKSFAEKGIFVTETNDTIYRDDFKGLWIAGSVEPLTWDFENLYGKHDRKFVDRGDGIFEATVTMNPTTDRPSDPTGWKIDSIDSRFPTYASQQMLVDAIHNMAIADIVSDIRPDDTYRAGAAWDGVWTRDVSYSIYLALAYLDPQRSMNSLRAKVKNDRIVQDTGTGGSWPVSSDRVVWTIAAWEIYKVTGDQAWLKEAYEIIKNTLADDMAVVWDANHKMMHGEQSYLDWREQTYPKWMQPKDIYESMCLGTNVVFAETFDIMSQMAAALGDEVQKAEYEKMATTLGESINSNLWIPNLGYYSEYLYGGIYPIQSQAVDNLGQALSVIFGVANDDMAKSIIAKTPVNYYGTSSVFPQMPDIKPYHNDAVWPFVQAYWNLAAAKVKNMEAFTEGLGAIYRSAALFGTHKELFVSSNGDYRGTAVNSDAQLWSATGSAAMIYRVIAGMEFAADGISFNPFVPAALSGDKTIAGFRYRDAVLDIVVKGVGSEIKSFSIDGVEKDEYFFPATESGPHSIVITMADNKVPKQGVNRIEQAWMPSTPIVSWTNSHKAVIENNKAGISYNVYLNGVFDGQIGSSDFNLADVKNYTLVDFVPVEAEKWSGFTMKPYEYIPEGSLMMIQAESAAQSGTMLIKDKEKAARFVEITRTKNTHLEFAVEASVEGTYFVDVRYANGSGPINTENKCAIRSLMVNGAYAGSLVMPQRGIDEWLSTGFSNMLAVELKQGHNVVSIDYLVPQNVNMNEDVNTALIDYIRIIKK